MKLPNFRRLFRQDFDKANQPFVDKLALSFNPNIETLYQALNKKIDLSNNIDCSIRDVVVTVDSDGIPTTTTTYSLDDQTRAIKGTQVIFADNQTDSNTYPTGGIFVTFQQVQTGIQISHVAGLPANNKFTLRIISYY